MADDANGGKLIYQIDVDNKQADKNLKETSKNIESIGDEAEQSEKKSNKAFEGIKKALTAAAIGATVIKIAKTIANATAEFEKGREAIIKGTGATGKALDDLYQSAQKVFGGQGDFSFVEIADALGEVNTRFALVGKEAEKTTAILADFADFAGTNVKETVGDISQLMNKWGVELSQMPSLLDKLTASSQASGISAQTLINQITDMGGTLQSLGMSLDESVAMFAKFEKMGVNSQSVIMAMKQSFAQSAKAGRDAKKDWQELTKRIANAKNAVEANEIAVKIFGARIGSDLVSAIRNGSLAFDDFEKIIEESAGALERTAIASETTAEKFQKIKNTFTTMFADVGAEFAPMLLESAEKLAPIVCEIVDQLKPLIETTLPVAIDIIEMLVPLLKPIADVVGWIVKAIGGIPKLFDEIAYSLTGTNKQLEETKKKVASLNSGETQKRIDSENKAREKKVATMATEIDKNDELYNTLALLVQEYKNEEEMVKNLGNSTRAIAKTRDQYADVIDRLVKKVREMGVAVQDQDTAERAFAVAKKNRDQKALAEQSRINEQRAAAYSKSLDNAKKQLDDFDQYERQALAELYEIKADNDGKWADSEIKKWENIRNEETLAQIESKAKWIEYCAELTAIFKSLGDTMKSYLADQIVGALQNVGSALVNAGADWEQYGIDALKALSEVLSALAKELALLAIKAALSGNLVGAGIAAAGAVAAGIGAGVLGGIANNLQKAKDEKDAQKALDGTTSASGEYTESQLTNANDKGYDLGFADGETAGMQKGEAIGYQKGYDDGYIDAGAGVVYQSLSQDLQIAPASVANSVNFSNNQNIVLEVDGQQLAYTNIRYMDDVSQFAIQGA